LAAGPVAGEGPHPTRTKEPIAARKIATLRMGCLRNDHALRKDQAFGSASILRCGAGR
jgi:hypothetical protein